MNKKLIRLTESDLHRIVRESVNRVLREDFLSDLVVRAFDRKGNELTLGDIVIWKNEKCKVADWTDDDMIVLDTKNGKCEVSSKECILFDSPSTKGHGSFGIMKW